MIAVDTSALMAIILGEARADACIAALEAEDRILLLHVGDDFSKTDVQGVL